MEPGARTRRPTPMRSLALSFAALIVPLSLAGCGSSDDGDDVATDPAPTTATSTPSPTAEPTVGTYPEFGPTDYTFELTVSCFCAGGGTPIKVTVAEAVVVGATYTADDTGRGGTMAGDAADESYWLTINDVIGKANDTKADRVNVDWPAGQDYPTSVYVDSDKTMADEEVSYTIANVVVS
jgi:hypothetical protein